VTSGIWSASAAEAPAALAWIQRARVPRGLAVLRACVRVAGLCSVRARWVAAADWGGNGSAIRPLVTIPPHGRGIPQRSWQLRSSENCIQDKQKYTAQSYSAFGVLLARPRSPRAEADPLKGSPVSVRTRPGAPSLFRSPFERMHVHWHRQMHLPLHVPMHQNPQVAANVSTAERVLPATGCSFASCDAFGMERIRQLLPAWAFYRLATFSGMP
jgi:hypothetical protein